MADDIVERLNRTDDFVVFVAADGQNGIRLMTETERRQEAAAEIERLRAERDAEHALADRLVHLLPCFHLSQRCRAPQGTALEDWCSECAAIAAYEEARRG